MFGVLRSKQNLHPDKSYNKARYVQVKGTALFRVHFVLTLCHIRIQQHAGRSGLFHKTRDIVQMYNDQEGNQRFVMIDKTTCVFQLKSGRWVKTGVVESAIEEIAGVHNAVVFGSSEVDAVVAVIWTTGPHSSEERMLEIIRGHLSKKRGFSALPRNVKSTISRNTPNHLGNTGRRLLQFPSRSTYPQSFNPMGKRGSFQNYPPNQRVPNFRNNGRQQVRHGPHAGLEEAVHTFSIEDWEIPQRVIMAQEPWEYRPRAKIRNMLKRMFGNDVNDVIPGAVQIPRPPRLSPVPPSWPPDAASLQVSPGSPNLFI